MSKVKANTMHHQIEQTIGELGDVTSLLKSQIVAGMPENEVMNALFVSWLDRLAGLPQTTQSEKAIVTAALSSGPWSESQRKELAKVVLMGSPDSSSKRRNQRPNQKCGLIENFIPEETWVKLKDIRAYSELSRASLLAGVAQSIGLECPDQPTLYRMVSILAFCENNFDMEQTGVHKLMDKMQSFIKGQPRHVDMPYLENYPCAAHELPKGIQDRAYPSGVLPIQVDIPELGIILGDNKMRGRRRVDAMPEWLRHVPDEYKSLVMQQVQLYKRGVGSSGSSSQDTIQTTGVGNIGHSMPMPSAHLLRKPNGFVNGFGELTDTKGKHVAPEEASPIEKPGPKPIDVEEVIESPASCMPMDAIVVAEAAKPDLSVEELEASMLAGLHTKKHVGNQRAPPKNDEDTTKKATILKKPAGVTIVKKPAALSMMPDASNVDLTGLFAKLRTRRATMDLKRFTSMAYHHAKKIAEHAGFSDDKAKAIARDSSGKASSLFNEMGTY